MKELKGERKTLFNHCCWRLFAIQLVSFALQAPTNKITMSQLRNTVNVNDFTEFPIEMNEQVLEDLNRFHLIVSGKSSHESHLKRYIENL